MNGHRHRAAYVKPLRDIEVTVMKRLFVVLALLAATFMAGCGLVHTYEERKRRFRNINELQSRMIVDDFDYFWLVDRPTYLSYWYVREAD
jgi:hypothetical protein